MQNFQNHLFKDTKQPDVLTAGYRYAKGKLKKGQRRAQGKLKKSLEAEYTVYGQPMSENATGTIRRYAVNVYWSEIFLQRRHGVKGLVR